MPVEPGLERAALRAPPAGGDKALGDIALAAAVVGSIDREAEGGVAVRERARDMIIHPSGIAAHIELIEAQRIGRCFGEILQARIAH